LEMEIIGDMGKCAGGNGRDEGWPQDRWAAG
jgi:hypothetical protein